MSTPSRIHISTALDLLSKPEAVNLTVLKKDGSLMELEGCVGLKMDKYKGTRRAKLLRSGEIRMIRDCLILYLNGMEVVL